MHLNYGTSSIHKTHERTSLRHKTSEDKHECLVIMLASVNHSLLARCTSITNNAEVREVRRTV